MNRLISLAALAVSLGACGQSIDLKASQANVEALTARLSQQAAHTPPDALGLNSAEEGKFDKEGSFYAF